MKIMGHRGSAGLAMENTEKAIKLGIKARADAIEIDLRKTKDNILVLCHDDNLMRVAGNPAFVRELTYDKISKIELHDGEKIIDLKKALKILGTTPVMIDVKDEGCARILNNVLNDFPKAKVSVASFNLSEVALLRELNPKLKLYGLNSTRPLDVLHLAKVFGLDGIGLNYWVMNPLTYFIARRKKLDIYLYTVNHRFTYWFIRVFYPGITVCTNFPNKFVRNRRTSNES